MPDRGLLERASIAAGPAGPHDEGATWSLGGVRIAQVTFEVNREAALSFLPEDVGRPVPCYARLIITEAASSPAGSFRMANLFVGGRYRMMPRNLLVEGIVDGDMGAVAAALGGPFRPGSVEIHRVDGQLTATVAASEGALARVLLPALSAVDPGMLRWDAWLGFADLDGAVQLVEYGPRPAAAEAFLSKGATLETPAELPRAHTWRQLRNLNTISACYLEGSAELALPQVQQVIA
ncbi:MAG: hypothetical protein WD557_08000 [Dehalococcoidia bacterium]